MEKVVIYVAGNPGLYPLEYYHAETQTYEGIIPQLLARFCQESQYDVRYYQPEATDQREDLAANQQVDLISGCIPGESFAHTLSDGIVLLETTEQGEPMVYQLLFTDVAPTSFQEDLRQFFSEISPAEWTGMLLQEQREARAEKTDFLYHGVMGLSVAIAVLFAVLAMMVHRYRKCRKKDEQQKETDEITGIGNAAYLEHQYPLVVKDQTRILYTAMCFYTDTDRMNRLCGQAETEQFLRHTAVILNEYVGPQDLLARVIGVGFVLLQSSRIEEVEKWVPIALKRIRDFSTQYGKPYHCEVCASLYALQQEDRNLDEVLFKISQSAHLALREGKDLICCTTDVLQQMKAERQMQSDIAAAFEKDEFVLYVQFYVHARTYQIMGGEALARWQHPQRGLLGPAHFITMMEQENMIDRLDYHMLEKSCLFLSQLEQKGIHDFSLSCNFSRKSFGAVDFPLRCKEILDRYSFSKDRLIFELTESAQAKSVKQVLENMQRVKQELGVKVVLDDFGVGVTSFYDLQEYPISGVKMDKGLVDRVDTPKGRAIMQVMVQIGHELGLTILAEGVEDDAHLKIVQELGCDAIQGFRFYYPVPVWEAEELLVKNGGQKKAASPSKDRRQET